MSETLPFPESRNPVLAEVLLAAPGTEEVPPQTTHESTWLERLATAGGALLAMGVIYLIMR